MDQDQIEKQIAYWRTGAEEDMAVGRDLVDRRKFRHGLFFVHLALEKALKALVCRVARNTPPRIHDLLRLAELAHLDPSQRQREAMATMNVFNIEGRYTDTLPSPPTEYEAHTVLSEAEEVFQWLTIL